jgi:hypothetical protein
MNSIDFLNESALYVNAIFLATFTEWVDVEARYQLGWVYMGGAIFVVGLNLLAVFLEIIYTILLKIGIVRIFKKVYNYFKLKFRKVEP